ncbi:MAG TPA: class I SAM-dependent methyltransferase [Saprospiraceae bacterium]|nr:class I SAM-dependent methyltransferase [Saprospiraceae bacterium]
MDYKATNKKSWNIRTEHHVQSEFYNVKGFLAGETALDEITLDLIGDIKGKKVLHLQCHFGLDTLSLARMGAKVTGMDLSDKAIDEARLLAEKAGLDAEFICCDIYDLPDHLDEQFDVVFTSYGVVGWLPDMNRWAEIVTRYLKPSGRFVFIEFHPVVWMFDDDFTKVTYRYFKTDPIIEEQSGTYAATDAPIQLKYVCWNHGLGEVVNSLITNGLQIASLKEYDFSPYDSFRHTVEISPKRFRIKHLEDRMPIVYSVVGYLKE